MAQINQVAEGIYRISSFLPTVGISFNQFLIDDEHPTLIHTGTYPLYEGVRQAVSEILDPKRLAYIVVSHFEADECGGMGRFVAEASQVGLAFSTVGAKVNLMQWVHPMHGGSFPVESVAHYISTLRLNAVAFYGKELGAGPAPSGPPPSEK